MDLTTFNSKLRANSNGCLEWMASLRSNGYGQVRCRLPGEPRARVHSAHRASWVLHNGAIPEGMCVLHRCDNPRCCNPEHLFCGSLKDNADDMVRKGRHARKTHPSTRFIHGSACTGSLLTAERVLAMRAALRAGVSKLDIVANNPDVGRSSVYRALARDSWKWLEEEAT